MNACIPCVCMLTLGYVYICIYTYRDIERDMREIDIYVYTHLHVLCMYIYTDTYHTSLQVFFLALHKCTSAFLCTHITVPLHDSRHDCMDMYICLNMHV